MRLIHFGVWRHVLGKYTVHSLILFGLGLLAGWLIWSEPHNEEPRQSQAQELKKLNDIQHAVNKIQNGGSLAQLKELQLTYKLKEAQKDKKDLKEIKSMQEDHLKKKAEKIKAKEEKIRELNHELKKFRSASE